MGQELPPNDRFHQRMRQINEWLEATPGTDGPGYVCVDASRVNDPRFPNDRRYRSLQYARTAHPDLRIVEVNAAGANRGEVSFTDEECE